MLLGVIFLLVPKTPEEESWRMRNEDRKEAVQHAYHLLRWVVGLDPLNEEEKGELRCGVGESASPTPDRPECCRRNVAGD